MAARDASGPDPRFDWPSELISPEHFHGLHSACVAGALITHLRHEVRPRIQAVAYHAQFLELLHERLLGIDMFVVLERGENHGRMMEVRRIDDNGIEIS